MRLLILICILTSSLVPTQEKPNEFEELAIGYVNQGKLTQAAEIYSKAGYAYWNGGNSAQAEQVFQKAYDLFSSQGNILASIAVGNNLGLIYLDKANYSKAYSAFSNVLKFARKTNNNNEVYNALINFGMAAYELSSYSNAISAANEALILAKEQNQLKHIGKCYSLLAECYEKMGDGTNAYKYFELYTSIDNDIKLKELQDVKQMSVEEISKANQTKRVAEIELRIKKGELKLTKDSLTVSERISYQRKMQVELRNEQLRKKEIQLRYELYLRRTLITGIGITVLFVLIIGFFLKQKLSDNRTLTQQRNKLDIQNKKIIDSIHYGNRIQQAMLPDIKKIESRFSTSVIFKPKDIVSGDFYWYHEVEMDNTVYLFVALVDCTGHGVPGAFMSMIGHRLLSEVVIQRKIYQPSQVLHEMNDCLRKELDQNSQKSTDGMDMAFCRITIENGQYTQLVFAGAKRPILLFKKNSNQLSVIEGDRYSIGGYMYTDNKLFTNTMFDIEHGDMVIMYSDGIIDQQNSDRNRFGTSRLISIIQDNTNEPISKISKLIEEAFDNFKKLEDQRDDATLMGFRL